MTVKQKLEKYFFLNRIINILAFIFFKLIRIFRRNRRQNNGVVAIIALHKLGDTVFTIPAIVELIKHNRNKKIYIICFEDSKIIYKQAVEGIEYVILSKNNFYFTGRFASIAAIKKLSNIFPEIIVDLTGSVTSSSLIFTSNCKTIYGVNETLFKGVYDNYHEIRKKPHQIDIYFDAVGRLVPIDQKEFTGYKSNFETTGTIIIQPFAGWEAKEWGLSKFINLYKKISKLNDCTLILPPSSIKPDVISSLEQDGVNVIYTKNIESLITEIKKCKLFISNDSGPLQIAALLGKPTFCIYGPTNPMFHIPFGEYHSWIKKQLKCSPEKEKYCFTFGGRYCPHYDCLKLLSVDEVFESVVKLLIKINRFTVSN